MENTTLKTVAKLKDKHRRDVWIDDDGYVWFYEHPEGWRYISPQHPLGWCATQVNVDKELDWCGPFQRLIKGAR